MGDKIIGIKAVHEVSRTRKAMNKHCTKVMLKSKDAGGVTKETTATEESVMDAKIIKSLAVLSDTGRAYVAQLEDDKVKSFFDLDKAAQDAEIKTWDEAEKAKSAAAEEAEKLKAAGDPEVVKLKARVAEMEQERVVEKAAARDLQLKDIAKSKYGSVPNAFDVLKSIEGLDEAARKPVLDTLANQQEIAKSMGVTVGEDDASESGATVRYDAKVAEVMKEKNISKSAAALQIAEDPANAQLIREYRAELAG